MTEEIAFVVNPVAGRGGGVEVWRRTVAQLTAKNLPYSVRFTGGPGDATVLTAKALRDGARTVISIGGDGTAHEVVNGFFEQGRLSHPAARVAFLSAGTGNDIGRLFQSREAAFLDETATYVDV